MNDNIPVAGETFREFVKKLYQRNELVRGEFRLSWATPPVDLERITCPLLLLMATGVHLVPPSQTSGILPHVGSTDIRSRRSTPATSAWRSARRRTRSSGRKRPGGSPPGAPAGAIVK